MFKQSYKLPGAYGKRLRAGREPGSIRGNQPPPWDKRGREREREVWGEETRIITPAGLIAINIKNQINMSRCVFHFFAYTRRVNEKRGEREREGGRARKKKERLLKEISPPVQTA